MTRFSYQLRPVRVVFGAEATDDLAAELSRAGRTRAFLLSTPGRRDLLDRLDTILRDMSVGRFVGARLHVPADVVEAALRAVDAARPDCLVCVGGGSAIGLGKALAVRLEKQDRERKTMPFYTTLVDLLCAFAPWRATLLLVAQGLDRVEPGRLPRWVVAKGDADRCRDP